MGEHYISFVNRLIEVNNELHRHINVHMINNYTDFATYQLSIPDVYYFTLAAIQYNYFRKTKEIKFNYATGALYSEFHSGTINPETFLKDRYNLDDEDILKILKIADGELMTEDHIELKNLEIYFW